VILFHDLNFWTAVGQIGIGVMAGMALGAIVRRARRLALPPAIPSRDRICPACGAPALRRFRGASHRRLFSAVTGRWPYRCVRCNWPEAPKVERARAVSPTRAEPASRRVIEAQPAASEPRVSTKDDATQVKDAVFGYLALLNAGDVTARAHCYLSEFTSFDADGRPLKSNGVDWRAAVAEPGQTFDLRCRDLRVYIHKDTAIATAYLVGSVETPNGPSTRVSGRSSWVLLRQNGEWKIAHTHLSPLSPEI
jgi:ketosteroid isomerase-like protein